MVSRQIVLRASCAAGFLAFALAGCSNMKMGPDSSKDQAAAASSLQFYRATLSASQEVPPNASTGTGVATVRVNPTTNTISWSVTYSGLTGPASMAHIHGPAPAGVNAGVMVPFQNVTQQPIQGQATLTAAQMADLVAGRTYVNVHTAQNPGGEIRGQLQKQ